MLDVKDGLVEQLGDVVVMQRVDDAAALPVADHKTEVTQLTQLVRNRGGLHPNRVGEITDRARAVPEAPKDLHAAGRGQHLHAIGHQSGQLAVDLCRPSVAASSMTHLKTC